MNKFKILFVLCLGFTFGYTTHALLSKNNALQNSVTYKTHATLTTDPTQTPPINKPASNNKTTTNKAITKLAVSKAAVELSTISDSNVITHQQALETRNQYLKQKVKQLERQLDDLEESDISNEQMSALVIAPFDDFITHFTGKMRKNIFDFHQSEPDLDWGYNMQNQISDFILTHYYAAGVNLVSLTCKQQQCELLVTENEPDSWQKIAIELTQQPWWPFTSTSANSGNYLGSTGLAFYTFLSR